MDQGLPGTQPPVPELEPYTETAYEIQEEIAERLAMQMPPAHRNRGAEQSSPRW